MGETLQGVLDVKLSKPVAFPLGGGLEMVGYFMTLCGDSILTVEVCQSEYKPTPLMYCSFF